MFKSVIKYMAMYCMSCGAKNQNNDPNFQCTYCGDNWTPNAVMLKIMKDNMKNLQKENTPDKISTYGKK